MKKIAIVNQRCGLEVNGGSEYYTLTIAGKLSEKYDVEILTTCARDYTTWENYYAPGADIVNGVKIRRFPVTNQRNWNECVLYDIDFFREHNHTMAECEEWIVKHGPHCTKLIDFIGENKNNYDVFIFITYEFYHTVLGLPLVSEKSILIPTAHDDKVFRLPIYKNIFECPRAFVYLTEEERRLIQCNYATSEIPYVEAGVGVDLPEKIDIDGFLKKININFPYIIFVGRIDYGKGCDILFNYFLEFKRRNPSSKVKLVLMGKPILKIPSSKDIVNLGFVDEVDKYAGIAASEFMILSSKFESLSISTLEAMSLGKTLLVNGNCEVLKGHCTKSNGALYYDGYFEFEGEMNFLLSHPHEKKLLEQNARQYVEKNYNWGAIMRKFDSLIEII